MITQSAFKPAWWLPGAHLQTLWPNLVRRSPRLPLHRERLELPDGDFLDLGWTDARAGAIVLVLHGLEGSSYSAYARGILKALHAQGLQGVLMHFRGCSGEPNRLPRSYHSGETADLAYVVGLLRRRYPERALAAVGYSLGGNALLKWLGESGEAAPLQAAVAVSVPFRLDLAADRLERGPSRLYQWHLLARLKRSVRGKFRRLGVPGPCDDDRLRSLGSFREFDDAVTAPLHGFRNAADYYRRCSARQYLDRVRVPTLIIHALDDPFMYPEAVPEETELSPAVTLELSPHGGHVGFVAGPVPWQARYWLESRISEHLAQAMPGGAEQPSAQRA